MQKTAFFALHALLAASAVSAQDVLATVNVYTVGDCGEDPNNPDLDSFNIEVLKGAGESTIGSDGNPITKCEYSTIDLPGWPTNPGGQYTGYVDENNIPDGCQLLIFGDAPSDDEVNQGHCFLPNHMIPNKGTCTPVALSQRFGYSMCCGTDTCNKIAPQFPSKKREVSTKAVRDVTVIKRTSPFERSQKRDCAFSGSGDAVLTYGSPQRTPNSADCTGSKKDCDITVNVQYSSETTNTFGVTASVSAGLFDIVDVSVGFSYEHSDTTGKTYSTEYTAHVPAGTSGYIVFTPQLECSPDGTFSGCDGVDASKNGHVCFPVIADGIPVGSFSVLQTS